MGVFVRRAGIAIVVALAAVVWGQDVRAAGVLEKNFGLTGPLYEGVLPPCDAPEALDRIASRFADKEHTYWNSELKIVGFSAIRETAFRPWAADTIPRRFCSGVVKISDGRSHTVHYSIIEDTGIIGANWGVEWCVVGLDRNWAFNPACKMARP